MSSRHLAGLCLLAAIISVCSFARAWALSPGDSCSIASAVTMGDGYLFVCDGSNWKAVLAISDDGQSSLQIENDTGSCTAVKTGRLRYNDSTGAWDYCDGSNWTAFVAACDDLPDNFTFPDVTNVTVSTNDKESAILQMTGIGCSSVSVSINGDGTPEYRTCSDSGCGTVVQNWTTTTGTVSNNQYLQLRLDASSQSLTVSTATVNVGAAVDNWTVTTEDLGTVKRVFVASGAVGLGGAFGGISGADQYCQNDADTAGLGGTYYAWVAIDDTDDPESRFTQASIPYQDVGGGTIANNWADLIDGNLLNGPTNDAGGNSVTYGGEPCANGYLTNVGTDGIAYSSVNNCNGWTSNGSGYSARRGVGHVTYDWWTEKDDVTCNINASCILCFEQ